MPSIRVLHMTLLMLSLFFKVCNGTCADGQFANDIGECVACPLDTFSVGGADAVASYWAYFDFEPDPIGSMEFNYTVEGSNSTGLEADMTSTVEETLDVSEGDVETKVVGDSGVSRRLLFNDTIALNNFTLIVRVKVRTVLVMDSLAVLKESKENDILVSLQEKRGEKLRMRPRGDVFKTSRGERIPAKPSDRQKSELVFALDNLPRGGNEDDLVDIREALAVEMDVSVVRVVIASFADGVVTAQLIGAVGKDPSTMTQNVSAHAEVFLGKLQKRKGWAAADIGGMVAKDRDLVLSRAAREPFKCCMQTDNVSTAAANLIMHYTFDSDMSDASASTKLVKDDMYSWNVNVVSGGGTLHVASDDVIIKKAADGASHPYSILSGLQEFTVSAWVYPSSPNQNFFLCRHSLTFKAGYYSGQFRVCMPNKVFGYTPPCFVYPTVPRLVANKWYHMAVSVDLPGKTAYVYINHQPHLRQSVADHILLSIATEYPVITNSGTEIVASDHAEHKVKLLSFYTGYSDDFRVYDRALDSNEINDIFFETIR